MRLRPLAFATFLVWRLRRWRLWFLALMTATRFLLLVQVSLYSLKMVKLCVAGFLHVLIWREYPVPVVRVLLPAARERLLLRGHRRRGGGAGAPENSGRRRQEAREGAGQGRQGQGAGGQGARAQGEEGQGGAGREAGQGGQGGQSQGRQGCQGRQGRQGEGRQGPEGGQGAQGARQGGRTAAATPAAADARTATLVQACDLLSGEIFVPFVGTRPRLKLAAGKTAKDGHLSRAFPGLRISSGTEKMPSFGKYL